MAGSPRILLICRDRALVEAVREAAATLPGGRPLSVAKTAEAVSARTVGDVGLILVHLDARDGRESELEPVARMLWVSSTLRRPIPVLALTDEHDAERDLALFRMGVADTLNRLDHLDRLDAVIAALSSGREDVASLFTPAPGGAFAKAWVDEPVPVS
jgi:hypothetical protein